MTNSRSLRAALCMLLFCTLLLPFAPVARAAESGTCGADGDNLTWTLDDNGTLTISGQGAMADYSNTTPAPWGIAATAVVLADGVTSVGDWAFYRCSDLTDVTIPNSITSIGDNAFNICFSLSAVAIPDSVTSIGDQAFSLCSSLTTVTIPDSVTEIGANPFSYCRSLKTITVSPRHPVLAVVDGVLFSKADRRLVTYPSARDGTSYMIPDGIEIIGDAAFYGCSSLNTVTLPDSVTEIAENPFKSCSSLRTITVSPRHPALAVIDGVLFSKADRRLIAYPAAINSTSYAIPDGIEVIGGSAFFACSGLSTVTIPDSVTAIGNAAFSSCHGLRTVTIPASVTTIGNGAFISCSGLSSITIPDSVTSIGDVTFYSCSGLSNVTIPNSVTSIGDGAFSGCSEELILTVERDSYAEQYCLDNGLHYTFPDALDWLND